MNFALLFICHFLPLGLPLAVQHDAGNIKTLNFKNSASEIVKDLVSNWNSPLVYLRKRGYLQTPALNLGDVSKQSVYRAVRSYDTEVGSDLNNLFRTLFSTNDNSVSERIKSKMGVTWDMENIKNSVRENANKFYRKFYNKHTEQQAMPAQNTDIGETDLDKQVAQLYPSVVPNELSKELTNTDKNKAIVAPIVNKKPKFMSGLAKLLSSRQVLGKSLSMPVPQS